MYKPLPYYLTIKQSKIEGLGLFATDNIDNNFVIGITHVFDTRFENHYVRTPLGGFFNHSENPNCEVFEDGEFIKLRTIREIKAGEEITAKYTFYNPIKPTATLQISSCKQCPFLKETPAQSTDGWDRGNNWNCKAKDDKIIESFVELHNEDIIPIPKWCPCLTESTLS
jgi:hypothetical protein